MDTNRIKIAQTYLLLIICSLCSLHCSDPLSEEEKAAIVTTIVSGPFESGEYVIFWDGTNDQGGTVRAGTYYARLWSRDFTHQIQMTALEGGKTGVNDSSFVAPGFQPITKLLQNHPEPFPIRSGTNIPFTLASSASIELTIRNRE
jgi:hypothetical protein